MGTTFTVAAGGPTLAFTHKLVQHADQPRMTLSRGKLIYPGRKQVFRRVEDEQMAGDTLGRWDEQLPIEKHRQRLYGNPRGRHPSRSALSPGR